MTINPFAATTMTPSEPGVFGSARRVKAGFLYRVIEIETPVACRFVYDGWWFRQRITLSGHLAWWKISWLTIQRRVEFKVPPAVDPNSPLGRIEIEFGAGLSIRRFRIWIDEQLVYDEIN